MTFNKQNLNFGGKFIDNMYVFKTKFSDVLQSLKLKDVIQNCPLLTNDKTLHVSNS